MKEVNNRSYWDRMYLVNKGGGTALPISKLEVRVKYINEDDDLVDAGESDGIISGITAPGTLPWVRLQVLWFYLIGNGEHVMHAER